MQHEKAGVITRLRSAEGHLGAVIGMLEVGVPCEQVLHQLIAVQAAIRIAGTRLLVCQVEASAGVIVHSPCPEERIAELNRLANLCQTMMKSPKLGR